LEARVTLVKAKEITYFIFKPMLNSCATLMNYSIKLKPEAGGMTGNPVKTRSYIPDNEPLDGRMRSPS